MYKNFKKLLTIFMLSLLSTQVECAPAEEVEGNKFSSVSESPTGKEAREKKLENLRRTYGLDKGYTKEDITNAFRAPYRDAWNDTTEQGVQYRKGLEDHRSFLLSEIDRQKVAAREEARKTDAREKMRNIAREAATKGRENEQNRVLNEQDLSSMTSLQFNDLYGPQRNQYVKWLVLKTDLSKPINEQSDTISNGIKILDDAKDKFTDEPQTQFSRDFDEAIIKRIDSLTSTEILSLDSSYFENISTSQILQLTPDQIQQLSSKQVQQFAKPIIRELKPDQLKALFSNAELVAALSPEQVQAINSATLAKAIEGSVASKAAQLNPLGKNKIQTLPDSFVDSLTPEQAQAVLDMHNKTFAFSHYKNYFTESQRSELGKLATQKDNSTHVIHAQRLAKIFVHTDGKLSLKDSEALTKAMKKAINSKEAQSVINAFIKTIGASKSGTFQNDMINQFFKDYVKPNESPNEWAIRLKNDKTNHETIEIINMSNIDPEKSIAGQYEELKSNGTLTEHRDGHVSAEFLATQYGRYFVAKKLNLKESFESQTTGFDPEVVESIEVTLKTKINNGLKDGSVTITDLDPSYIKYIDTKSLTDDQIRALTADQRNALTPDQTNALNELTIDRTGTKRAEDSKKRALMRSKKEINTAKIDLEINTLAELFKSLTPKNAGALIPRITDLSSTTIENLSATLAELQAAREKYLADLGFESGDTPTNEEIRTAYKKLALTSHPDRVSGSDFTDEQRQTAQNKFKAISAAYSGLTEDIPNQTSELTNAAKKQEALLIDVRQNKTIQLTPEQLQGFAGILLTLGTIIKTVTDISKTEIQPEPKPKAKGTGMLARALRRK